MPTGAFRNAIVQNSSTGTLGLNNSGDTFTLYDLSFTAVNIYAYGSDGGDPNPMVKHSQATNANGAILSPGTKVDGSSFDSGSSNVWFKRAVHTWVP
jgi:hypothetical protein